MPTKLKRSDWMRTRDDSHMDLLQWFIIHALVATESKFGTKLDIGSNKCNLEGPDGEDEITFTVNGVELDVIQNFKDLDAHIDSQVNKKAAELISEKFAISTDRMQKLFSDFEDHVRTELNLPEKDRY